MGVDEVVAGVVKEVSAVVKPSEKCNCWRARADADRPQERRGGDRVHAADCAVKAPRDSSGAGEEGGEIGQRQLGRESGTCGFERGWDTSNITLDHWH